VEIIEDDFYITIPHDIAKKHFITYIAYQTFDKLFAIKLYPEQNAEVRFKKYGAGKLYYICTNHGLFEQILK
jgi:desulfoferrodoxin (superoxide reductase-like protein)